MPCIQTLGVTFTLCSYCYAMLVDVDWFERIHDKCESYLVMDNIKVATLIHLGGLVEAPGVPSVVCFGNPGVPV